MTMAALVFGEFFLQKEMEDNLIVILDIKGFTLPCYIEKSAKEVDGAPFILTWEAKGLVWRGVLSSENPALFKVCR